MGSIICGCWSFIRLLEWGLFSFYFR